MAVDTIKRRDGRLWDTEGISHNGRKMKDLIFPVGFIYLSFSSVNPGDLFGGKWEQIPGSFLVGYNSKEEEFNSIKKKGGSKFLQKHRHQVIGEDDTNCVTLGNSIWGWNGGVIPYSGNNAGSHVLTDYVGEGNSGNLPPYIVCYMWYRVS